MGRGATRPPSVCSPANEVPSCGGNFSFPLLPQVAAQSIPRRGVQRKLRLGSSFTVSLSAAAFAGEAIPLHAIRHMFNVHIHGSRITSQPSLGLTKRLRSCRFSCGSFLWSHLKFIGRSLPLFCSVGPRVGRRVWQKTLSKVTQGEGSLQQLYLIRTSLCNRDSG